MGPIKIDHEVFKPKRIELSAPVFFGEKEFVEVEEPPAEPS